MPRVEIDNYRVRNQNTCPFCMGSKDLGTVACWPCYRSERLRYGNPEAETVISGFEDFLCSQERR